MGNVTSPPTHNIKQSHTHPVPKTYRMRTLEKTAGRAIAALELTAS